MPLSLISGGYRLFSRFDIGSRLHPRPPDDRSDGVLAETEIAGDPAITAALGNERQHFGCQAVGLRAVANLPPKLPAPRLGCGESGANSLSMSRSNCAIPASIVAIIRPCGVSTSKVMPLIATTDRQPDSGLGAHSVHRRIPLAQEHHRLGCHFAPSQTDPVYGDGSCSASTVGLVAHV